MLKFRNVLGTLVLAAVSALSTQAATIADVLFVVDESGSMAGEHAWIGNMVTSLNTQLIAAGATAQYGLIGFGGGGAGNLGRTISVGGSSFGTAAQLAAATASLTTGGSTEDGYAGINFALSNYAFRAGAAVNIILVTDEDRDNASANTLASTLAALGNVGAKLNVVVNNVFSCGGGGTALGRGPTGNGYQVGAGGTFTTCSPSANGAGAGNTTVDYVNPAFTTGGAAWDLNILRNGGNDAAAFTAAFTSIKVQEVIISNPVPEPSSIMLSLTGLGLLVAGLRRRRQ